MRCFEDFAILGRVGTSGPSTCVLRRLNYTNCLRTDSGVSLLCSLFDFAWLPAGSPLFSYDFFADDSVSKYSVPGSLGLANEPVCLGGYFGHSVPTDTVSSGSSFSKAPGAQFTGQTVFFKLYSTVGIVRTNAVATDPTPYIALCTTLVSYSEGYSTRSSSRPAPRMPL